MNSETDRHIAKAHEEVATKNAQVAVKRVSEVEATLTERIVYLENVAASMQGELKQLQNKYNLLLTKNFDGGSTS